MLWYLSVCLSVSVCLCVGLCVYIYSCNCCVLAPFDVKIRTRVSCMKPPHACEFFIEIFEKNMYFTRFCMHFSNVYFSWKNLHFLFVTLSHMIGFSSNFYRRRKIQLPYGIFTLKRQMTPFPRIFFWKHEISTVPVTSKNWKIHDFFEFLVLSSYSFLSVKLCVEHDFAGFRAIWCHKRTFFWWFRIKKKGFFMEKSALCCL